MLTVSQYRADQKQLLPNVHCVIGLGKSQTLSLFAVIITNASDDLCCKPGWLKVQIFFCEQASCLGGDRDIFTSSAQAHFRSARSAVRLRPLSESAVSLDKALLLCACGKA